MDHLSQLRAFVHVCDEHGFAKAARVLRLSPASVTRLVAGLEERLSIRLLRRTTRSLTLTDAGARYLDRARRILLDVDEAERAARAEHLEPTGELVVAASIMFGQRHVARVVSELLLAHPRLRVRLALSDRPVSLTEEGIDVAIRIGAVVDESLRARTVGSTRRVLVGSPGYFAQHRAPSNLDQLKRHTLIHFTGLSVSREWRPIEPRFTTDSAQAAITHAEQGGGLALVLGYQAQEAIDAGRLVAVLERHQPQPLPIHVVYPASRLNSAATRAFVDLAAKRAWDFSGRISRGTRSPSPAR